MATQESTIINVSNPERVRQLFGVVRIIPGQVAIVYHCPYRNTDRTLRFKGRCACGRSTWAADDGENDPRGIMGDNASHALVAGDHDMEGPDVPLCAICANEYDSYQAAIDRVMRERIWRKACQGHESLAGEHMGQTVHCDGSCQRH